MNGTRTEIANSNVESTDMRVSEATIMGEREILRWTTTLDEVIVYPIPTALYLVKSLLQYYIFAYVDAPGYQILQNFNIISTGVLYRIILKKKGSSRAPRSIKNRIVSSDSKNKVNGKAVMKSRYVSTATECMTSLLTGSQLPLSLHKADLQQHAL
ncbi:uncharacterized protein LOC133318417 [Gastrolobium bilobum]|uniref:uncharacterized protein LOC133318417 n=1 Tax=Gastrolobium bilobum TaxID=150636 RepID=UPI002AB321A0|nr:uncharacterized protein LOC133318417 [Gastrolobium bilobum]